MSDFRTEVEISRTPEYRKAFDAYLRRGAPIELSLKAERDKAERHKTTHYIWRTRVDDKVRATHAANNGKVFAWDYPPDTGHPGEDYNCRCIAEDYVPGQSEFAYQDLITPIVEDDRKWTAFDFVLHAYRDGSAVTLSEIGHMRDIIEHYAYYVKKADRTESGVFGRINQQVIHAAREAREGYFTYDFDRVYNFEAVSYPHGESVVFGIFKGHVKEKNGLMRIDGTVEYFFDDEYTDPIDLRQLISRTSGPMPGVIAEKTPEFILTALRKIFPAATPEEIGEIIRYITDLGGVVYPITGQWWTRLVAEAELKESESIYKKSVDE